MRGPPASHPSRPWFCESWVFEDSVFRRQGRCVGCPLVGRMLGEQTCVCFPPGTASLRGQSRGPCSSVDLILRPCPWALRAHRKAAARAGPQEAAPCCRSRVPPGGSVGGCADPGSSATGPGGEVASFRGWTYLHPLHSYVKMVFRVRWTVTYIYF